MRTCYLITADPYLVQLARLDQISQELGLRVEIAPRVVSDATDEHDLLVIDVRTRPRDILSQFMGMPRPRRRCRPRRPPCRRPGRRRT